MTAVPAVCELDGPIILGPNTSKTLINDMITSLHRFLFFHFTVDIFMVSLYHGIMYESNSYILYTY